MVFKEIKVSGINGIPRGEFIISFRMISSMDATVYVGGDTITLTKVIPFTEFQNDIPLKDITSKETITSTIKKLFLLISTMSFGSVSRLLPTLFEASESENFYFSVKFFKDHESHDEHWYFSSVTPKGFVDESLQIRKNGRWVNVDQSTDSVSEVSILSEHSSLMSGCYYFDTKQVSYHLNQVGLFEINDMLNSLQRGVRLSEVAATLDSLPKTDLSNFVALCRYFGLAIKDLLIDLESTHPIKIITAEGVKMSLTQLQSEVVSKFKTIYLISESMYINNCLCLFVHDEVSPAFLRKVLDRYNDSANKAKSQIVLFVADEKVADVIYQL